MLQRSEKFATLHLFCNIEQISRKVKLCVLFFIATDRPVEARTSPLSGRTRLMEHANAAMLNSLNSADAKRGYRHAIDEFFDWYCSEPRLAFNRIVVLRYRSNLESRQLAPGTIDLRLGRHMCCI